MNLYINSSKVEGGDDPFTRLSFLTMKNFRGFFWPKRVHTYIKVESIPSEDYSSIEKNCRSMLSTVKETNFEGKVKLKIKCDRSITHILTSNWPLEITFKSTVEGDLLLFRLCLP